MQAKFWPYTIGFLIGSNIYIALVSTTLALTGFLIFHTPNLLLSCALVFFTTQTAYNFQRYFKWRKKVMHPFLLPYVPQSNSTWLVLLGINASATLCLLFILSFQQLFLLSAIGIITGFYIFIHPFTKKLTGLRYVPYLKTLLVAICWTGLFFIVTFPNHNVLLLKISWQYWLIIFIEIWQACVLFDLRDVEADKNEVKTFANTLSDFWIIAFWLLLSITIVTQLVTQNNYTTIILVFSFIGFIQLFCVIKKPGQLLFTFLVDGSLLLFAFLNYFAIKGA